MKKLISIMTVCAAVFAMADAGLNSYVQLVNPSDTATITGTGVDISAYKGNAVLLAEFETSTTAGYTGIVTFAHSANNSSWATITNINGTACVLTKTGAFTNTAPSSITVDSGRLKKYIRASVSQPGANTNAVSAMAVFTFKAQ